MTRCGRNIGRRILEMVVDMEGGYYLFFPAQWADNLMSTVMWQLEAKKKRLALGCYWLKNEKAKDGTNCYVSVRQYRETPIPHSTMIVLGERYELLFSLRQGLRNRFKDLKFAPSLLGEITLDKRLMFYPTNRTPHLVKTRRILDSYTDE